MKWSDSQGRLSHRLRVRCTVLCLYVTRAVSLPISSICAAHLFEVTMLMTMTMLPVFRAGWLLLHYWCHYFTVALARDTITWWCATQHQSRFLCSLERDGRAHAGNDSSVQSDRHAIAKCMTRAWLQKFEERPGDTILPAAASIHV